MRFIGLKPGPYRIDVLNGVMVTSRLILEKKYYIKVNAEPLEIYNGMSGGCAWHNYTKIVIGMITRKQGVEGLLLPISEICKKCIDNSDIPNEIRDIFLKILEPKTITYKIFSPYQIGKLLDAAEPNPFRATGPEKGDFESGDWIYLPKEIEDISRNVHEGKIVIIRGKPATGKSVIARYIGFESLNLIYLLQKN